MFRFLMFVFCISACAQPAWEKLSLLAKERFNADDFGQAECLRREALQAAEETLGVADPVLAPLLTNLALSLHFEGRDKEADPLVRRAVVIAQESGDRRLIGLVLNTLGVVLAGEHEFARAEPVLRRSLAMLEEIEGPDALDVAQAANNLSTLYTDTRQFVKAKEQLLRALPILERRLGAEHPLFAMALTNMFSVLYQLHRISEGEPYLQRALEIGGKAMSSLNLAHLEHCLALLEINRHNYKEAARLLQDVIVTEENLLGAQHPVVAQARLNYAELMRRMQKAF